MRNTNCAEHALPLFDNLPTISRRILAELATARLPYFQPGGRAEMAMIASRKFDEKMADMRRYYESMTAEKRTMLRLSLEKLSIVAKDMLASFSFLVSVQQEIDVEDEEGNPTFVKIEFCPGVLLEAVKAWDANDNYAPSPLTTFFG
jgi:hypothetical protein